MSSWPQGSLHERLRRLALQSRLGLPLEELDGGEGLSEWVGAAHSSPHPRQALAKLGRFLEESDRLLRRIRQILVYPKMVLGFLMVHSLIMGGLLYPLMASGLRGVAEVAGYSTVLRILASPLPGLVLAAFLFWFYRFLLRKVANFHQLPELYGMGEQALWCRAMAYLLRAGVSTPAALTSAAAAFSDPRLRVQAQGLAAKSSQGSHLSQALEDGHFDKLVLWGAQAGENSQDVPSALEEVAHELDLEIGEKSELYLRWLQPGAMAALGLITLASLLSFWLPYYWLCMRCAD